MLADAAALVCPSGRSTWQTGQTQATSDTRRGILGHSVTSTSADGGGNYTVKVQLTLGARWNRPDHRDDQSAQARQQLLPLWRDQPVTSVLSGVRPLRLSPTVVADPPVVLAPMAGITNVAFRRLCRQHGAGLYVSEMITTRALVERNPKTLQMIEFAPDETPRSIQLYGIDPGVVEAAVRILVSEDRADHIDLNFGCPVPKVTRKGGGAALPWRIELFTDIVRGAVRAADGRVPVTIKMRVGIDDEHRTFLDAGLRAQDAGVAAVALHGRTAAQHYSGAADWAPIADAGRRAGHPGAGQR